MSESHVVTCGSCGQIIPGDALVCPRCNNFVYRARLEYLAAQATTLEPTDPRGAARIWQQCLPLLPLQSPQYQNIVQRIAHLSQAQPGAPPLGYQPPQPRRRMPRNDPPLLAIGKTVGSMVISAVVYAGLFGSLPLAIGFVVLMLVHEMGHVFALWYYGLRASPPIFIPFIGALINLRESPPNALAEAVVGMGGPFLGSIGAFICMVAAMVLPQYPVLWDIAYLAAFLNFFNLLPVPPLDGGRITAALSPWLWILGLLLMAALFFYELEQGFVNWILIIVLFMALPRIKRTLQMRHRDLPYYQVPRSGSFAIGAVYVALALALVASLVFIRHHSRINF